MPLPKPSGPRWVVTIKVKNDLGAERWIFLRRQRPESWIGSPSRAYKFKSLEAAAKYAAENKDDGCEVHRYLSRHSTLPEKIFSELVA